jgi:adenylate cyclase
MVEIGGLFDWLVDGAPGATNPAQVVTRVCEQLAAAGLPLVRAEAFVRTLHPHIAGRSFLWEPGKETAVVERTYAFLHSPLFLEGPVAEVFRSGKAVRLHTGGAARSRGLDGATDDCTEFYASPLRFLSGQSHAVTFATRAPGGFTDEHLAAIDQVMRPLARVGEIMALARTATNLLDTYVGHGAGGRILSGKILRGDTETLRAVIQVLNQLFDCQVPAIEARGGEVLKFMGDGLLAILPLEGDAPQAQCDAMLAAADQAFLALATLNATLPPLRTIRFGLALHIGEIAYGNIGGANRLDFTCIGPAVNLASRLEGLTGKLDRDVVVSAEFARHTTRPLESLGHFDFKGVPGKQEAFAPRR